VRTRTPRQFPRLPKSCCGNVVSSIGACSTEPSHPASRRPRVQPGTAWPQWGDGHTLPVLMKRHNFPFDLKRPGARRFNDLLQRAGLTLRMSALRFHCGPQKLASTVFSAPCNAVIGVNIDKRLSMIRLQSRAHERLLPCPTGGSDNDGQWGLGSGLRGWA
jgi:hypothetical protein